MRLLVELYQYRDHAVVHIHNNAHDLKKSRVIIMIASLAISHKILKFYNNLQSTVVITYHL